MLKSIHDITPPAPAKAGSPLIAFLFLTAMALGFLGAALVLGTEPRLVVDRRDTEKVNRKRRRDLHLDLIGTNGARLGWDKESDARVIEEFMRGNEPSLSLTDAPPLWRLGAAWFLVGLGGLTFLGAIQSFFPKKNQSPITPIANRHP